MRNEMRDEIFDEEVAKFIKDGISRAVEIDGARLDRIEKNVLEHLQKRTQRKGIFSWLRLPALPTLPSMRPAWALAAAIAIFLIGFLSGVVVQNTGTLAFNTSGQGVLFVMAYPEAKEVQLAGDFTKWDPVSLTRDSRGMWSTKLDLAPGRHEYVFIVDGMRMVVDPRAQEYVKSYDHLNSVIFVS
ncbi:hypothetical protein HY229_01320 [Candidatus Acetothermia bacterium]|nr:hypothetical protein [Candidatus Acetothermia bacterium]MBI3642729.1 hypothetical protein [Candidatus Acetothermia bacterium]